MCASASLPNVSIALTGTAPWSLTYAINGVDQTPVTGIPANSYIITGAAAGIYTVSALSDANCTGNTLSAGSATVTVNPLPTATVSGGGTVCAGASLPNVSIALTGAAPWALTYAINGINQTPVTGIQANSYIITGAAAGIYTISALSDANCTGNILSAGSATVTVNPSPLITATSPGSRCGAGTVTLGATTSAGTVNWYAASTGGSSIATGNTYTTPSISTTTTYYVDATNNGCTTGSRTAIAATVNTLPATPTVSVTTQPTCAVHTGTVTITAPTGTGITYSIDGSTYTNTTGIFIGVAPDVYTVTAMLNSCVSFGTTVTVNAAIGVAAPVITVVDNCNNTSLLTASGYTGTLLWSPGGAKTTSITVSTAGTYSVTQTISGCTSSVGTGIAAPGTTPPAPVVTVVNNCGSSTLSPTATGALIWSHQEEATQSITVTTPGIYSVTQFANGCNSPLGSNTAAPKSSPTAPVITKTNNCGNSLLSYGGAGTLLWSTGETTTSITVTTGGTYSLTRTVNGCTSAAGTGIAAPTAIPPTPVITVVNNCGNSLLSYGGAGTLLWSTGKTTTSITVTTGGTYSLTRTVNGCTSAVCTGVAAPTAIPPAPVVTVVNNCGSSTLSTTATGALIWSHQGEATQSITVTTPGIYSVTQFANGCNSPLGSNTAAPKSSPTAPVITVTNNCGSSVLSTTAKGTLQWSTGATTSSITVTATAAYSVTTTVNGCTSAAGTHATAPKAIPPTPVITVVNNCGSSVLSTTTKGSLLWTSRYTTSSVTATTAGTYLVIATVNGCASLPGEATAAPLPFPYKPVVIVVNNCGSSTLYTTAAGALKWSTNETTLDITVTAAATYSLTQTVNGCISADGTGKSAPVKSVPATAGAITGNSTGPCNNTSPFTYSIAAVPGATSYIWVLTSGCTAHSIVTTVPNIEVTFTPLALMGYMFVQASNACGAGNASNKKITLNCPGKWTPLTNKAPHNLEGDLTLLSDGTVLALANAGGGAYGNVYDRLTPVNGSYLDGRWDSIAPMHETRLWYSSQVLKDGRLYVAGGEYGTGGDSAEVYDPLTGLWTSITNPKPTNGFFDANSEVLDNGNVLQSVAISNNIKNTWQFDITFNPTTGTYTPCCTTNNGIISNGNQDESTWVKLPDGSIFNG